LTISSKNFITLKNFKVIGGQFAVRITGTSQGTIIENNYLTNGRNRIILDAGGGSGTIIRNNKITLDAIGMVDFTPGDRNTLTYPRKVNRWMYDVSKFLIGDTETNDASILISAGAANTQVVGNEIYNGMMGIVYYGVTSNNVVSDNTFHNFSDIGIYMNADLVTLTVTGNLFYDAAHHMRLESMSRSHTIYIYTNRFHNPHYGPSGGGGKHIFIPPPGGNTSPTKVWVYHNSFAGGGWAVDLGGTAERSFSFPLLHVLNNFISTNGISSGGTGSIGELASNYIDKLWFNNTIPDFVLPVGHKALGSGIDLMARGLPGMTTTYYTAGRPDIGAIQGRSQSTMPPPTRLRATTN
jgi:parallel beta-helix repeat protein